MENVTKRIKEITIDDNRNCDYLELVFNGERVQLTISDNQINIISTGFLKANVQASNAIDIVPIEVP